MRKLSKSALSYSWAMSLFGVRQIANILTPRCDTTRGTEDAFYSVTQAAKDEFSDLLWAAFQVGDELQRDFIDLAFDFLTLRAFHPGYITRLTSDVAEQSQITLRAFTPGGNCRLTWREFMNNYEVYNLVKHTPVKVPQGREFSLGQLVEDAYALGAYPDLWAIEGLGHDYAATFWGQAEPIRNILTNERAGRLPDKSLTMLHAGMGLFFAQQLMRTVTPFSPACEIRGALQEFIALCKDNSRRGYTGAAYESLGLVTRTLHSQMVPIVDRQLSEIEPEVVSYFWHGAGRALYFLPIYFAPGLSSPWRAAEREPPHELGRLNMVAGLAWAKTIVNLRQPEIMESFLKYQGRQLYDTRAFTDGVMSSLIIGYDITPGDIYITRFLRHQPDPSDSCLVELWNNLVGGPANDAALCHFPALKKHERMEEAFHHKDLADLVARLEGGISPPLTAQRE
jgi:hypothetical protein